MKRYFSIFIFAVCASLTSFAQSDFGIWTSIGAEKKLWKGLSASVEGEFRSRNDSKSVDRWAASVAMGYKFCPYLKANASYSFLYLNHTAEYTSKGNYIPEYWSPRNRFKFSLTGSYKFHRFQVSLREAFQYTHRAAITVPKYSDETLSNQKKDEEINGKSKNVLRSMMQVAYNIRKSKFSPFASLEFYNSLDNGFSCEKTRWTVGSEYEFNKHNEIEAYYRYQNHSDDDEPNGHVLGLGYKFKW